MANTSIFSIDIDDTKAKAYFALVEKYQKNLAQLPGMWGKVALAEQPVVAAMAAQTQLLTSVLEGEKRVANEAQRAERSWLGISSYVKGSAKDLASMTLTLAKWTGIAGSLGAIFGAISLDRIAGAVAGTRRAATGLGISYGQQQAFGLDLGRFVDPGSVLGASRNALYDVTNPAFVALRAAGVNPQGNAADTAAALLEKLPGLFAGTPRGLVLPRAHALGINQFLSDDDLIRFLGANPNERKTQIGQFKSDSQNLDLQQKVQRGWQDFLTALERAGLGIENVFVKGLAPLVQGPNGGPLGKLAESVERAAQTFLSGADKWIGPLGDAIEKFAKYLTSDDFTNDLESFKQDIGDIASAISDAASWIRSITPGGAKGDTIGGAAISGAKKGAAYGAAAGLIFGPEGALVGGALGGVGGAFYGAAKFSNAEGDLLNLVGQLENAKRDPNAVSRTGAIGLYQIEPGTARQYGRDPSKLTDPTYNAQTATLILRDLVKRYHGDVDKVLAAYNAGPGRVDRGGPLPAETQGYIARAHANQGYQKVVIEVHDATGASSVTAASQIGAGGTN